LLELGFGDDSRASVDDDLDDENDDVAEHKQAQTNLVGEIKGSWGSGQNTGEKGEDNQTESFGQIIRRLKIGLSSHLQKEKKMKGVGYLKEKERKEHKNKNGT
jgi:hypothetical protein